MADLPLATAAVSGVKLMADFCERALGEARRNGRKAAEDSF
jgi:hypothetical protein